MNIDDLKQGSIDENGAKNIKPTVIENPNLKSKAPQKREQREIDPAKEFGLKSTRQLDQEDPDKRVYEDKIFDDIDRTIDRKRKEFSDFEELYDQADGDVSYDDIVDMENGFDPIAMLNDPPKPGHIRVPLEQKKKMLEEQGYSEDEINRILNIRKTEKPVKTEAPEKEDTDNMELEYTNEDIDETEELEREILEGIPEEEHAVEAPADKVEHLAPHVVSADEYDTPTDNSKALEEIPDTQIIVENRDEDKDLEDLDEDVVDDGEDEITKNRLALLKESANSKIRPITQKFDISTFSISKSPVNVNNVKPFHAAKRGDWVLMSTGIPITMTAFKGTELDILVSDRTQRNNLQLIREQYSLFYNHLEDPYKPADLEAWTKCIAVTDIDNLYACAYRASFEGVNFLPYDCQNPKCNNSFVTDSIPFMDMVKFKNDEAKKKFNEIFESPHTEKSAQFKVEVVPVSDQYAFGIRMPSIYDVVFVMNMLDDDFKEKYQDVIAIAPYIDSMYYIDAEHSMLNPINVKSFRNNVVKSTKAKIITLAKIIKNLSSDEYNLIKIYTSKITDTDDEITFKMPSVTCEKCKSEIPEQDYTASQLLFLRHHLASLVNG